MTTIIPAVVHQLPVQNQVEVYAIQEDVYYVKIEGLLSSVNYEVFFFLASSSSRRAMSVSSDANSGSATNSNDSSSQISSNSSDSLGSQITSNSHIPMCKYSK